MKKNILIIASLAIIAVLIMVLNAESKGEKMELATFGAGCFWGVEANFQKINGVEYTDVGYSGGETDNPTYKEVCYSDTKHAEVVHLKFDPAKVSYRDLCKAFFKMHDPTTLNRQGPDHGDQYRSVIFYHSDEQKKTAQEVKDELNASTYKGKIVTFIEKYDKFWMGEDYHQDYYKKRGISGCATH